MARYLAGRATPLIPWLVPLLGALLLSALRGSGATPLSSSPTTITTDQFEGLISSIQVLRADVGALQAENRALKAQVAAHLQEHRRAAAADERTDADNDSSAQQDNHTSAQEVAGFARRNLQKKGHHKTVVRQVQIFEVNFSPPPPGGGHRRTQGVAASVSCDFEGSVCGWQQGGTKAWQRTTHAFAQDTGAARAQGGQYFMLLETSQGRIGDRSYLTSPKLPDISQGRGALSFYFHMYGGTMGVLSVEIFIGGRWRTVWHKRGQQHESNRDTWAHATVRLPASATRVRFKGTKGTSSMGDMCIDTVDISGITVTTTPPPPPPAPAHGAGGTTPNLVALMSMMCDKTTTASTCVPQCTQKVRGDLLLLDYGGEDHKYSCERHDDYYSWIGPAAEGGYLGKNVRTFVSAVISGAAGLFALTLKASASIITLLTVEPGQVVTISATSKTHPLGWGKGGFKVAQRGALTLRYMTLDSEITVEAGATLVLDTVTLGPSACVTRHAGSSVSLTATQAPPPCRKKCAKVDFCHDSRCTSAGKPICAECQPGYYSFRHDAAAGLCKPNTATLEQVGFTTGSIEEQSITATAVGLFHFGFSSGILPDLAATRRITVPSSASLDLVDKSSDVVHASFAIGGSLNITGMNLRGSLQSKFPPPTHLNPRIQTDALKCGKPVCEYKFTGIQGTAVSDLTGSSKFIQWKPDSVVALKGGGGQYTKFQMHTTGDNLGVMLEGWLLAPMNGMYTFITDSDDASEVWVATKPNTMQGLTKAVQLTGCCKKVMGRKMFKFKKDHSYYIKALVKEGGGGEYLRVGMKVGGKEWFPIPLSLFGDSGTQVSVSTTTTVHGKRANLLSLRNCGVTPDVLATAVSVDATVVEFSGLHALDSGWTVACPTKKKLVLTLTADLNVRSPMRVHAGQTVEISGQPSASWGPGEFEVSGGSLRLRNLVFRGKPSYISVATGGSVAMDGCSLHAGTVLSVASGGVANVVSTSFQAAARVEVAGAGAALTLSKCTVAAARVDVSFVGAVLTLSKCTVANGATLSVKGGARLSMGQLQLSGSVLTSVLGRLVGKGSVVALDKVTVPKDKYGFDSMPMTGTITAGSTTAQYQYQPPHLFGRPRFVVRSGPCTTRKNGQCVGRPHGYQQNEKCEIDVTAAGKLGPCPVFQTIDYAAGKYGRVTWPARHDRVAVLSGDTEVASFSGDNLITLPESSRRASVTLQKCDQANEDQLWKLLDVTVQQFNLRQFVTYTNAIAGGFKTVRERRGGKEEGQGMCLGISGEGAQQGDKIYAYPCWHLPGPYSNNRDSGRPGPWPLTKANLKWDFTEGSIKSLQPQTPFCVGTAGTGIGASTQLDKCTAPSASFHFNDLNQNSRFFLGPHRNRKVNDKSRKGTIVQQSSGLCLTLQSWRTRPLSTCKNQAKDLIGICNGCPKLGTQLRAGQPIHWTAGEDKKCDARVESCSMWGHKGSPPELARRVAKGDLSRNDRNHQVNALTSQMPGWELCFDPK